MKELSIEEKAKAYDEAINRMKHYVVDEYGCSRIKVADVFPELKESEDKDERIRKTLLNYFKRRDSYRDKDETWDDFISFKDIIAWLEKQKDMEAKLIISDEGYSKAFQDGIEEALTNPHKYGLEKQGRPEAQGKSALEASNEEKVDNQNCVKSTDKVEHKFKVGDWLTDGLNIRKIIALGTGLYVMERENGTEVSLSVNYVEKNYHLWSIEDAKDGDVLAFDDETIVIFKDLYNTTTFHSYCHVEEGAFSVSQDDMPDWWEGEGFHPATKKQCDLLFQKMKRAGYEWDAKKKELKKIEQESIDKYKEWYDFIRLFVKQRTDNYNLIPSHDDIHKWGDDILNHARKVLE